MTTEKVETNENINNKEIIEKDIGEKTEVKNDKVNINPIEKITALKVKADPENVSAEERKRSVKKLAGAISHSLRQNGEINVRAFGSSAIGKAVKALAIAKNYVSVQNLQLECSPAFITTKIGENELTGMCFVAFAYENPKVVDIEGCKSILMVKADPEDIEDENRKANVQKLAGAIFHSLENNKEVVLRCFGNKTISKATKAMAIARGKVAVKGGDMYMWPIFIVAKMNENERTGIAFYCYSNAIT